MERKFTVFFIIILLFICGRLTAQNAYYDACYLSDIDKLELATYIKYLSNIDASDIPEEIIDNFKGKKDPKYLEFENLLEKNLLIPQLKQGAIFILEPWEREIDIKQFKNYYEITKNALHAIRVESIGFNFQLFDSFINQYNLTYLNYGVFGIEPNDLNTTVPNKVLLENIPESGRFTSPLFQTRLIDAIGTIIAERFKADITEMYLNKFKDFLKSNKFGEYTETFLPNTFKLVTNSDPFTYTDLGNDIKTAFQSDLDALPQSIIQYIDTLSAQSDDPTLAVIVIGYHWAEKLIGGSHPVNTLDYLDYEFSKNESIRGELPNVWGTIRLLNLLQLNLQKQPADSTSDQEEPSGWISFSDFRKLLEDEDTKDYFLRLITLQDEDFFKAFDVEKNTSLMDYIRNDVESFLNKVVKVHHIIERINQIDQKKSGTFNDYLNYMQLTLDTIKILYYDIINEPPSEQNNHFLNIFQSTLNTCKAIYSKQYLNLLAEVRYILEQIKSSVVKVQDKEPNSINNILKIIKKYGVFIEAIAAAKSSGDLKNVISQVILPRGSYLEKRTTKFSITIASFPGLYGGTEKLIDEEKEGDTGTATNPKSPAMVTGFTAPLGVEFTFGDLSGHSIGTYFTVFDLGAVVSYRLTGSEDPLSGFSEKITLKQVFTPGISLNLGLKNTPITLRAGWQYTPELRNIKQGELEYDTTKSFRWFMGLCWDLPLIRITPPFRKINPEPEHTQSKEELR